MDRIDVDKTSTEQLSTTFLSDVQLIAPGVKREPDVVLRRPQDDLMCHGIHIIQ